MGNALKSHCCCCCCPQKKTVERHEQTTSKDQYNDFQTANTHTHTDTVYDDSTWKKFNIFNQKTIEPDDPDTQTVNESTHGNVDEKSQTLERPTPENVSSIDTKSLQTPSGYSKDGISHEIVSPESQTLSSRSYDDVLSPKEIDGKRTEQKQKQRQGSPNRKKKSTKVKLNPVGKVVRGPGSQAAVHSRHPHKRDTSAAKGDPQKLESVHRTLHSIGGYIIDKKTGERVYIKPGTQFAKDKMTEQPEQDEEQNAEMSAKKKKTTPANSKRERKARKKKKNKKEEKEGGIKKKTLKKKNKKEDNN